MTKNKKSSKKSFNKDKVLVICVIIIVLAIIIGTVVSNNRNKKNKPVEILELKEIDKLSLKEVMKKIDDKESFVILIGYPGCQACEDYQISFQRVQASLEFTSYYLNYKEFDEKSELFKKFAKLININQNLKVDENGKEEVLDDTVGNILKKKGYTPVTVVIKAGKCVDAHIGKLSEENIEKLVESII